MVIRLFVILVILLIYSAWIYNNAFANGYDEGWQDKRLQREGKPLNHNRRHKKEEHI